MFLKWQLDELFTDYDCEHEPDEADDNSDPDFRADLQENVELDSQTSEESDGASLLITKSDSLDDFSAGTHRGE